MNIYECLSLIIIFLLPAIATKYDMKYKKLKEKAQALDKRLSVLEYENKSGAFSDDFIKNFSAECLLEDLAFRISSLEACRQCPLYLNILREGIEKTIQQGKEG